MIETIISYQMHNVGNCSTRKGGMRMKSKLLVSVTSMLLAVTVASRAADDAAALYKKKCAGCHGVSGEGKPAAKAPALKGTALDVGQLVERMTKGEPTSKPPHKKGIAGLTDEQAKAIADYIKTPK